MKKGFTLIELLGVIIVLAAILTIITPIVSNLIRDSKNKTKEASIEMYGRALAQASLAYELEEEKTPITLADIAPYLEYTGAKVECENVFIGSSGDVRIENCSVDGKLIEDYVYGSMSLGDRILSHAKQTDYFYEETPDFSKATIDGEFGVYSAKDDYGTSYYFRGDVENNYVQFGTYKSDTITSTYPSKTIKAGSPMYWRIVRINGDGTIRLVYDGTELLENGAVDTYGIYKLFFAVDYVPYNGYMNGPEDDIYKNINNSRIKSVVDDWYNDNLKEKYGKYISDSIFCNDREVVSLGTYQSTYAGYERLFTSKKPKLTCAQQNDRFTVNDEVNGNGDLIYPIGLLTADEAMFAGINNLQNSESNYLGNVVFWSLTPANLRTQQPDMILITSSNLMLIGNFSDDTYEVRPVINLNANVKFTGTGTKDDPYIIITE